MAYAKLSICLLCFVLVKISCDNIQMSVDDLELAIRTEIKIIENLVNFLNESKKTAESNEINRYIEDFKYLTRNIKEEGFDNPVHAYLLMRHMTIDYEKISKLITSNKTAVTLKNLIDGAKSHYPTGKDVEDAALSLIRLQSVYDLSVESIVSGKFDFDSKENKIEQRNLTLSAADCLRLGSQAVLSMNLNLAVDWFEEGLSRNSTEDVDKQTLNAVKSQYEAIKNIVGYGDMFEGLMSQAVNLAPSYILDMVNMIPGLPENFFQKVKASVSSDGHREYKKEYKQLCQGKRILDPESEKRLVCAYVRGNNMKYYLSPNKIEVLSYDPVIVVYHDLLSDKNIEYLKNESRDKLIVTKTKSSKDLAEAVSFARTGKMAFLENEGDEYLSRLSDRVEDVTGINVDYAENWQIVNYGIGGHYEIHHDYYSFDLRNISFPGGDRLATMLFYLNDVKAGGYTVFPILEIGVKPKKGSALFWYNLKRNGHGDPLTMHAACPILSGTKWISNLWLHSHGNEFIRPCTMSSDE